MNKKARSKNPLKPKSPFKWVFMDIIPTTAPKRLTSETNISNYLLIFYAYSKIPKFMVCRKLPQKNSWTSLMCSNTYLEK